MQSPALDDLRRQLRATDEVILHALSARARFPRQPRPQWPTAEIRLPPPPVAEILLALAPAGTATDSAVDAANRGLIDALLARQRLAKQIADAKAETLPDDFRSAIEGGDRDQLLALLTDLPTELRLLESIRKRTGEIAPELPAGLAPLLWREYIIPWTKQSEVAHLLAS